MSCIVWSWSLQLQTIHRISHLVPQELLKRLDCYCYFLQYYCYFWGSIASSSFFWYRFLIFSFHLSRQHSCSSLATTQRPNFRVVKNRLHRLGLPGGSCTLQWPFSIISFLQSTSAFILFRTSSVSQVEQVFWAGWIRRYWSIAAYDFLIFVHDKNLSWLPFGFEIGKDLLFLLAVLQSLLHNYKWVPLIYQFLFLYARANANIHWLVCSFEHTYLLPNFNWCFPFTISLF